MAFFNPSNQLIQIDTGNVATYLFNKSASPISVYANIGEAQVLGQRFVGVTGTSASNPNGVPAIYVLAQYLSTSATTTGNLTTAAGPVPVFWTDNTYTTVSGIASESALGLNGIAGVMNLNTVALPTLTSALLLGAYVMVQVSGFLSGVYVGGGSAAAVAGDWLIPVTGSLAGATRVAAGTAPGYRPIGLAATTYAAGYCSMLINTDNI